MTLYARIWIDDNGTPTGVRLGSRASVAMANGTGHSFLVAIKPTVAIAADGKSKPLLRGGDAGWIREHFRASPRPIGADRLAPTQTKRTLELVDGADRVDSFKVVG